MFRASMSAAVLRAITSQQCSRIRPDTDRETLLCFQDAVEDAAAARHVDAVWMLHEYGMDTDTETVLELTVSGYTGSQGVVPAADWCIL